MRTGNPPSGAGSLSRTATRLVLALLCALAVLPSLSVLAAAVMLGRGLLDALGMAALALPPCVALAWGF